ncbi:MAG: GNAT family protein [bacterium]|nr:GNAT family protein [bacterium]
MGTIKPFEIKDLKELHELLTSNRWEFFLDPVIDERGLKIRDEKYFSSDTNQTLVYRDNHEKLLGYIHFDKIENTSIDAPSFTVCVDKSMRGKRIGKDLVKKGVTYIFDKYNNIRRIYAQTREDNIPMKKTFESLGFRQEARYKKEWEIRATGEYVDTLGYAILREEFKQ